MLIPLLLLAPILGAFIISLFSYYYKLRISTLYTIALFTTVSNFIIGIVVWLSLDMSESVMITYNLTEYNNLLGSNISIGVDNLSIYFILLTVFTFPICILASYGIVSHSQELYLILWLLLESLLLSVFMVQSLLAFYIAFESILIPLFIIIGIWGSGHNRIRATFLFFLYTLTGSLFMLLSFAKISATTLTSDIISLNLISLTPETQYWIWGGIFFSLAVKTPLVPFHYWLKWAHSYANVAGSVILAGIVLKLAAYAILRILIPLLPEATYYFSPLVLTLAIISLIYSSLTTLRQIDIKQLVAYSSVAHMAVVILGLFSNNAIGIQGGFILSLAHGFVSPALFILVGGILYDRYHSRLIKYYRGLSSSMPLFSTLFVIATLANIGTPGSCNFIGEILCLSGVFNYNFLAGVLGALGIILSAAYGVWALNRMIGGTISPNFNTLSTDINKREFLMIITLIIPTILFGLIPWVISKDIDYALSFVLYS